MINLIAMNGEKNLGRLIKEMKPELHKNSYVFSSVTTLENISLSDIICFMKEKEGTTIVLEQQKADKLKLKYDFVAAWITLTIHSSLNAVGLTAVISSELTNHQISSNIITGYNHDHLFIDIKDQHKAMEVLNQLSRNYKG